MFSCKCQAAIEAVTYIALHSSVKPVSGKEVCGYQQLQSRHLEPVLQELVHKGILRSSRGPKGGYTLQKDKRKTTIAEIYKAVSEFEAKDKRDYYSDIHRKVIAPVLSENSHTFFTKLETITIEELCNQARKALSGSDDPDFNI